MIFEENILNLFIYCHRIKSTYTSHKCNLLIHILCVRLETLKWNPLDMSLRITTLRLMSVFTSSVVVKCELFWHGKFICINNIRWPWIFMLENDSTVKIGSFSLHYRHWIRCDYATESENKIGRNDKRIIRKVNRDERFIRMLCSLGILAWSWEALN